MKKGKQRKLGSTWKKNCTWKKIWKIENPSEVKSNSRVNSKYNKCVMGWNSTKRTSKIKLKDPIICIPIKKKQEILSKRILKPLIKKKLVMQCSYLASLEV